MSEFEIALLAIMADMLVELQTANTNAVATTAAITSLEAAVTTSLTTIDTTLSTDNAALVTALEGVATAIETSEPEASFATIAASLESLAKAYGRGYTP